MSKDPAEELSERVAGYRDEFMQAVRTELNGFAVYVPRVLLADALERIRKAATQLAFDAERAGEHYPYQRNTVQRTPPDGDRAPPRRRDVTTRRRR